MGQCETVFPILFNASFLISVLHPGTVNPHLKFLALVKVFSAWTVIQIGVSGIDKCYKVLYHNLADVTLGD